MLNIFYFFFKDFGLFLRSEIFSNKPEVNTYQNKIFKCKSAILLTVQKSNDEIMTKKTKLTMNYNTKRRLSFKTKREASFTNFEYF